MLRDVIAKFQSLSDDLDACERQGLAAKKVGDIARLCLQRAQYDRIWTEMRELGPLYNCALWLCRWSLSQRIWCNSLPAWSEIRQQVVETIDHHNVDPDDDLIDELVDAVADELLGHQRACQEAVGSDR